MIRVNTVVKIVTHAGSLSFRGAGGLRCRHEQKSTWEARWLKVMNRRPERRKADLWIALEHLIAPSARNTERSFSSRPGYCSPDVESTRYSERFHASGMIDEIVDVCQMGQDAETVSVLVVTGAGPPFRLAGMSRTCTRRKACFSRGPERHSPKLPQGNPENHPCFPETRRTGHCRGERSGHGRRLRSHLHV